MRFFEIKRSLPIGILTLILTIIFSLEGNIEIWGQEEENVERPSVSAPQSEGEEESSSVRFYKNKSGQDIPLIDASGKIIFQRSKDKIPSEMDEADFYNTLTPAENVILTKKPETSADFFDAAIQIARVGRPEFAALLAKKGLEAPGTSSEYADLLDRVGMDKLIHFSRDERVGDVGFQAAERIVTEAQKEWENPKTLQNAFENIASASLETQTTALMRLRRGGKMTFDLLLNELKSEDSDRSQRAKAVLNQLGDFGTDGILARLRVSDNDETALLADVLASAESVSNISPLLLRYYDEEISIETKGVLEKAIQILLGQIPSREEAAAEVFQKGIAYLNERVVLPQAADGKVSIWMEESDGNLNWLSVSTADALRYFAAQYLMDAWRLDPNNLTYLPSAVVAESQFLLYWNGLDNDLPVDLLQKQFSSLTAPELENALAYALDSGYLRGGILPTFLLGESGETSLCYGQGTPSVLVQAAMSKDRRLRFTALEAIDRLGPQESFVGASGVTNVLRHFASSSGKRKGIVAIPELHLAATVGNYLTDGDIQIVPAKSGGDLIRQAQGDADIEFALAESYLKYPDPRTVAQTLAQDYRTSDVPLLIAYEDDTRTEQAEGYGEGEKNALVYILPFDKETGRKTLDELYLKTNPEQIPPEIRLTQAKSALMILSRLRERGIDRDGIENPDAVALHYLEKLSFTDEGIAFALTVPTPQTQSRLANLAFDNRFDVSVREKYWSGLIRHLDAHGLLLRGPDILRLFKNPQVTGLNEWDRELFFLIADRTDEKAAFALAVPTSAIQVILGELIGDASRDIEERQGYLALLDRHFKKYGNLLGKEEIVRLYDRYNASETESDENQKILSQMLDSLEAAPKK